MKRWLCGGLLIVLACAAGAAESGPVALTRLSLGDVGGWIELAVAVDGRPGRWLLDTGSTRNLVSAQFAQRHGLAERAALTAQTALGALQGAEVALPALAVGALERTGQTALKVDLQPLLGAAAEGLDGVLGVPFLAGLQADLDLRGWTLALREGAWAGCPAGLQALPLGRHRGLPVLDVAIDGRPEALLLDTGNPGAVLRIAAADAAQAGLALPGGARLALARQVAVGPLQLRDVPVAQLPAPALWRALAPHIAGLAGTALLEGVRWRLDLGAARACVDAVQRGLPGGFGLTLAQREGELRLEAVLPGSPAQAAGLQAGDVVTRWAGGAPAAPLRELWARVQGQDEIEVAVRDRDVVRLRRSHFAPPLP